MIFKLFLSYFQFIWKQRKGEKNKTKNQKKTNRKLQAWNCVPIPVCILQPSSCQIQSPLFITADENKTNVQWTMNQTKEIMQINNTINLLSTKTEYSRYIIFEPIPNVHPTRFSMVEDALKDTNTIGRRIFWFREQKHALSQDPGRCLPPVTTLN